MQAGRRWSRGRRGVPVGPAVYSFVTMANVNMAAFFALAPNFRDDLDLSGTQRDVLFTGTGIAMLLLALPLGSYSDRVGARRVTLITVTLTVVSAVGHAVAVDFWSLLGARVLFAIGFTGMLTAAMAWLAGATTPERQARAIGGIMPCAGVGQLAGPYLAGALADASGTRLAFGVVCGLTLVPLVLGLRAPAASAPAGDGTSLRTSLAAMRAPIVAAAVVLTTLGIAVDTSLNLLVPQQLDDNGLSAGERGAILSAGGAVFVLSALVAVRRAHLLTNVRVAGITAILSGLVLIPLVISEATGPQAITMIVRGIVLSVLFVVAYPLGTLGANASGLPLGAAAGLLMLATGVATTVVPLAAGRGADAIGSGGFYAILAAIAIAAGTWMLSVTRTARLAAVGGSPAPVTRP
jgi:MFS family permease